jgi:uncharacterized protein (DUF1499 family)
MTLRARLAPRGESTLAVIAERLAFAAVGVVLVAILAMRSEQASPPIGIAMVTLGVVLAAAAVAVAMVSGIEIWRHGYSGLLRLFRAVMVAMLLLAYPALLASRALQLPVLNDISTDIADPPVFSTTPSVVAARGGYSPPDIDRRLRNAQERAYPAVKTLVLESDPEDAFQLVRDAVKTLKWRVVEEVRPDDNRGLGRIDAIDETRLMRFRDDITIRLRWTGSETRVDIRSASRVGRHDFGANARRILRLMQQIANPDQ